MMVSLRSWWQYIRKHRIVAIIIAFVIAVMVLIFVESLINGTGFNGYYTTSTTRTISGSSPTLTRTETYQPGKTLWDWLNLVGVLAIPAVVGLGAAWYTAQQGKVSYRENTDNQRETALQTYIDKMSELLLREQLDESKPEYKGVQNVARVRTLTVLPRLDAKRKRSVIQFLYESGLINKNKRIIDLSGADLSGVDLSEVNFSDANLREANLRGANLRGTFLSGADLSRADLSGADLSGALLSEVDLRETAFDVIAPRGVNLRGVFLSEANLREANLQGANLSGTDLSSASLRGAFLEGAIMSDGSIHP